MLILSRIVNVHGLKGTDTRELSWGRYGSTALLIGSSVVREGECMCVSVSISNECQEKCFTTIQIQIIYVAIKYFLCVE